MAMTREAEVQGDLVVTWAEMPRSPGHAFYDRLQTLLIEAGFDGFVETTCKPFYAPRLGAPSLPPGRYFRMHMIGYFEGVHSERGIAWRCWIPCRAGVPRLGSREKVPDHSWLSKTRSRLPHEVHEKVFGWVLALVGDRGLVKGERIGIDGSTMEANAALRSIVRRKNGELSPDANPYGAGKRITTPRSTISSGSIAPARARSYRMRTGRADRSRCEDRADEGWDDTSRL